MFLRATLCVGLIVMLVSASVGHAQDRDRVYTGEGGMLEEERAASRQLVYQITPARYGLDLDHLRRADGLELLMGQGAKPGTGGLLLGMKVSPRVSQRFQKLTGVFFQVECCGGKGNKSSAQGANHIEKTTN